MYTTFASKMAEGKSRAAATTMDHRSEGNKKKYRFTPNSPFLRSHRERPKRVEALVLPMWAIQKSTGSLNNRQREEITDVSDITIRETCKYQPSHTIWNQQDNASQQTGDVPNGTKNSTIKETGMIKTFHINPVRVIQPFKNKKQIESDANYKGGKIKKGRWGDIMKTMDSFTKDPKKIKKKQLTKLMLLINGWLLNPRHSHLTMARAELQKIRWEAVIRSRAIGGSNIPEEALDEIPKILIPDRLNVVGEDHGQSGIRRDKEKQVANLITTDKDNYWGEDEFKDGEQYGDPINLRFMFALESLFKIAYKYQNKISQEVDGKSGPLWGVINGSLLAQERSDFDDRWDLAIRYYKDLTEPAKEELSISMPGLNTLIFNMEGKKEVMSVAERIHKYIAPFIKTFTSFESWNFGAHRSEAMHMAANKSTKKGIWKIGDRHVRDIHAAEYTQLNYNLKSESDFNGIFTKWPET